MHAPSLHHKWQWLDLSATFIEHHHKIAAALLILIVFGMLSAAASRFEMLRAFEAGRETEMSRVAAETVKPLTRLTNPAFAQEYPQRASYIMTHLDQLREASQIDRAYVAVYEYARSYHFSGIEPQVFVMFESRPAQIAPRFENFQGISRENWLQMQFDGQAMNSLMFNAIQCFGTELYNEQGKPIGYLGIERAQGETFFRDREISQFQQTATLVEQALLLPLNALPQP